jgi:hypothetical protein
VHPGIRYVVHLVDANTLDLHYLNGSIETVLLSEGDTFEAASNKVHAVRKDELLIFKGNPTEPPQLYKKVGRVKHDLEADILHLQHDGMDDWVSYYQIREGDIFVSGVPIEEIHKDSRCTSCMQVPDDLGECDCTHVEDQVPPLLIIRRNGGFTRTVNDAMDVHHLGGVGTFGALHVVRWNKEGDEEIELEEGDQVEYGDWAYEATWEDLSVREKTLFARNKACELRDLLDTLGLSYLAERDRAHRIVDALQADIDKQDFQDLPF